MGSSESWSFFQDDDDEDIDIDEEDPFFDCGNITNGNFTCAPTSAPTTFNPLNLPGGFRKLTFAGQLFTLYLSVFPIITLFVFFVWRTYPLPKTERVSFFALLAALWSVFIYVGDYYSDILVSIQLIFAADQIVSDPEDDFDIKTFTTVILAISQTTIIISVLFISYRGKMNSDVEWNYFPVRLILVASGFYIFYLLGELVSARYYGGQRAKIQDIVRVKHTQGIIEGIPQIGLLVYLIMRNIDGLNEIVTISLCFSVASLVSGVVFWDLVREIYNKEEYVEVDNDVNYLFFDPRISNLYQIQKNQPYRVPGQAQSTDNPVAQNDDAKSNYEEDNKIFSATGYMICYLFHNGFTRILEVAARIGFYSTFALCTFGWGLIPWICFEVFLQLRFHGMTFILSIWLELIFNVRDNGNYFVARSEWRTKFMTTVFGYFIILIRLLDNPDLIDLEGFEIRIVFFIGFVANVLLYPWIVYLFSRQKTIGVHMEAEQEELEEILRQNARLEGLHSFGPEQEQEQSNSLWNWLGWRRGSSAA